MNTRHGSASGMAIIALGMAITAAAAIGLEYAARSHARTLHQRQVQGREYALGARVLPPGEYPAGEWRITVAADRTVAARHPGGSWRIAADGSESWRSGGRP
jgi:hypothetical protein